MGTDDNKHSHLVELIYSTLEDPRNWRPLYEELRELIGSESIQMLALDKRHNTLSYSDGANMPVEGELAYMQTYRFIDPRMPLVMARPVLEWMHCHESLDEEFVANDPFYGEFLLPYDRRFASACKLVDGEDATILFTILRTRAQGPLPAEAIALLDGLLPHLSRACRLGIRNFVYSSQALVGRMLVEKLHQPVVVCTLQGTVVHQNDAASNLLRFTRLISVEEGQLQMPHSSRQEMLQRCADLESAMKAAPEAAAPSEFQSIQIHGAGTTPETLYAFYSVLPPQQVIGTFGLRPVVMVIFYHPRFAPGIDSGLLYAAFGLSPAECRVAALLADGLSPKQIATRLETQPETVRKQLQAIFKKTSTNRQPELVRLLLQLPHTARPELPAPD